MSGFWRAAYRSLNLGGWGGLRLDTKAGPQESRAQGTLLDQPLPAPRTQDLSISPSPGRASSRRRGRLEAPVHPAWRIPRNRTAGCTGGGAGKLARLLSQSDVARWTHPLSQTSHIKTCPPSPRGKLGPLCFLLTLECWAASRTSFRTVSSAGALSQAQASARPLSYGLHTHLELPVDEFPASNHHDGGTGTGRWHHAMSQQRPLPKDFSATYP